MAETLTGSETTGDQPDEKGADPGSPSPDGAEPSRKLIEPDVGEAPASDDGPEGPAYVSI